MPHSMTGFGKAAADFNGEQVSVEVSSVNHRYLDCGTRLPHGWNTLEPALKKTVKDQLARGKVSLTVVRHRTHAAPSVRFDAEIARQYVEASKELSHLLGTFDPLSIDTLTQLDGVLYQEETEEDLDAIEPKLQEALRGALTNLCEMRATEGAALVIDVSDRIAGLRGHLGAIETALPSIRENYENKLRARVAELNADAAVTEERLAVEIAILADKSDVSEEVTRLNAHFDHAESMLKLDEPIGRKLDFLVQEIQREINTLGVKVRDSGVAHTVLEMKSELEKIREQIQNIE
jgi:uncharacterized protein (TIGR00255 family)